VSQCRLRPPLARSPDPGTEVQFALIGVPRA
jgi:hypothetical protein